MSLQQLDDQGLLAATLRVMDGERSVTVKLLRCLSEMEARSLYLKLGYASLFKFLVDGHHYSEASASRRVEPPCRTSHQGRSRPKNCFANSPSWTLDFRATRQGVVRS